MMENYDNIHNILFIRCFAQLFRNTIPLCFAHITQLLAQTNDIDVTLCNLPPLSCVSWLLFGEMKEQIRFNAGLHSSSCAFPPQPSGQILERAIEGRKGPLSTLLQMGSSVLIQGKLFVALWQTFTFVGLELFRFCKVLPRITFCQWLFLINQEIAVGHRGITLGIFDLLNFYSFYFVVYIADQWSYFISLSCPPVRKMSIALRHFRGDGFP